MRDLLRSLTKNERSSELLFFERIAHSLIFFAKKERFAQKTDERIPSPGKLFEQIRFFVLNNNISEINSSPLPQTNRNMKKLDRKCHLTPYSTYSLKKTLYFFRPWSVFADNINQVGNTLIL